VHGPKKLIKNQAAKNDDGVFGGEGRNIHFGNEMKASGKL